MLSVLDCLCDLIALGADSLCKGKSLVCNPLQVLSALTSCALDIVGVVGNLKGIFNNFNNITPATNVADTIDFNLFTFMGEFLSYALGLASSGGGAGNQPNGFPAAFNAR